MEPNASLFSTLLWVGLIGGIVWRFYTPLYGLLTALQKRVESGSTVKAGPFELTDNLRPQEPEEQKRKVDDEMRESVPASLASAVGAAPQSRPFEHLSKREQHFLAEDLALRAIQAEYGRPISRQVTAGSDIGFDGTFTTNGALRIVEVKFIRDLTTIPRLRPSLERIGAVIAKNNWRNVQLILAVVFESAEMIAMAEDALLGVAQNLGVTVTVRTFALPELQQRFGLATKAAG